MARTTDTIKIEIPESEVLADLYGIDQDLMACIVLCQKAIEFSAENSHNLMLIDGITCAALIRYVRCFSGGLRFGFPESDLASLSEELREIHKYLRNVRDKHVAHSLSPFEYSYVSAIVSVDDGVVGPIHHIHPGSERVFLLGNEANMLLKLSSAVREVVKEKIRVQEGVVLRLLRGMSLEDLQSFRKHSPVVLSASDAGKTRKQRRPKKDQ